MRAIRQPVALLRIVVQLFLANEITASYVPASICPRELRGSTIGGTNLLLLIIILLVLMFASFPAYPYSRGWGYYPSGGLGTILLIVIILWLLHVI